MLHDLAYEQCIDLHEHVQGGMREIFVDACGLATFADSMAAIKNWFMKRRNLPWVN